MALADLITKALAPTISRPSVTFVPSPLAYNTGTPQQYQQLARAAYGNEIVYSAIELLATSAAEPHIIGHRWRRNSPRPRQEIQEARRNQVRHGRKNRANAMDADAFLVRNSYMEETPNHPLIRILNNPNPYMSRGQMWATVVRDLKIAGDAYLFKARYVGGILDGAVGELWRLRPDRVKVIDADSYSYTVGNVSKILKASDVIHFRNGINPHNEAYGWSPLLTLLPRMRIDNDQRDFLAAFYETGGTGPAAILSTKGKMEQRDKDDIRDRNRRQFGPGNFLELMIIDQSEGTTYTPLSLNRGLRDALPKEINAMSEARIAMVFGIPGSILGLLIGYESSSYANKRQDWQVLWDVTMTPLLSDLDDVLNRDLVPEFAGIDEVCFDLSDIKALQEDIDAIFKRARDNVMARIWTLEYAQEVTGTRPPTDDEHYLLPDGTTVKAGDLDDMPAAEPVSVVSRAGRKPIEDDPEALATWREAIALKARGMTWTQISMRVNRSERQLREYKTRFAEKTAN